MTRLTVKAVFVRLYLLERKEKGMYTKKEVRERNRKERRIRVRENHTPRWPGPAAGRTAVITDNVSRFVFWPPPAILLCQAHPRSHGWTPPIFRGSHTVNVPSTGRGGGGGGIEHRAYQQNINHPSGSTLGLRGGVTSQ